MILDVDTGIDDALALALAVRHPGIRLEAVLTVAGNVGVDLTTRNTLTVLDWLGATHVPVAAGADAPLRGPLREASEWHGADGLGGAALPRTRRTALDDAVGYLIERVLAEPGELTLVCVAPLTNLALAVQRVPEVVGAVREVVLMGGAARAPGNSTPVAEFNIYADPEAADIVFRQSWPLTMVGLDVTSRVLLTHGDRDALPGDHSPEEVLVREVTRRHFDGLGVDAIALHDPLAVAVAVERDLVSVVETEAAVETRGEHTRGQTVVDLRANKRQSPLAMPTRGVCVDVNVARARRLFFTSLGLDVPDSVVLQPG
jgi:inosine-uridine nucleoside N-ribohydrolase